MSRLEALPVADSVHEVYDLKPAVMANAERIRVLERDVATLAAVQPTMQEDIRECKLAAEKAAKSADDLKGWIMTTLAAVAANLLYMLLKGAK